MREPQSGWYNNIWSLDIKNMSWVEETDQQVDFLTQTMALNGTERILDLACGFGRHSIAFAERGFNVVGVDITSDFIEEAINTAKNKSLQIDFICSDIRDIHFTEEFDVVLNLADGAIGYLEDDKENLKIFDKISKALKPGGKHFMDICNRTHAEMCFPKRYWDIGDKSVSLEEFSWDNEKKRMLNGGWGIPFGKIAEPPISIDAHSSIRLYDKEELLNILSERNITLLETYSDYYGAPDTYKQMQLMVYSQKCQIGC